MATEIASRARSKRVAFVAFSDIQIEDWKQYSENHSRLYHNKLVLDEILKACHQHDCPALFAGDLFDNPKYLSNLVLRESFRWLSRFNPQNQLIAIHGNHDQAERNSVTHESPNYIQALETILVDSLVNVSFKSLDYGPYVISGIPYLTNNDGMEAMVKETLKRIKKAGKEKKKKILLIHTDLPGAVDTSGREIGSSYLTWKLSKLFKGFDLVLSGHIHKPQIIRKHNPTIIMLGATHQQRVSDSGNKMGYWLIYEDLTYRFVELDMIPRFIYIEEGQPIPKDHHFYIVEKKAKLTEGSVNRENFSSNDPKKLTKSYLKVKGIKSKAKSKLLIKYLTA